MTTVGILAIQGDVEAHARALERAGATPRPILQEADLDGLHALILPGGESTTIAKGLDRLDLWESLRFFVHSGLPMLGTCAGAILLAREVENHPVETLDAIDGVVVRNAYGTQVDSFSAEADPGAARGLEGLPCVFIRAPRWKTLGDGIEILARVGGEPVLIRQGNVLAATFHPELTEDLRVHDLLVRSAG